MQTSANAAFVRDRLPWIIAAAAFLLYLVTLNRWISMASLPSVGLMVDPYLPPPLYAPLHFLLTYPLRWLPGSAQVLGLNLFAAVCAALTLALLARSVALLPHDRTRDQRHRQRSENALLSIPTAWIPPLFAVAVCGLHLAFWEHATAGTGHMLDLLLLAYIIRCFLEYRLDERESWLTRMALVYGLATANNYAMIAYAPVILITLIWICGRHFFNVPFLLRLAAWTLAGLSLYLVLPLLGLFSQHSDLGFWQALRTAFTFQQQSLLAIPRYIVLFGSLTSILPLLFIGIRWPASFGDTSVAGNVLTNLMFRLVHALFLVACLWVVFDAPFSPRVLLDRVIRDLPETTVGLPFLGLHYISALCIGYFAGYFLLLASKPEQRPHQRRLQHAPLSARASLAVAVAISLAVPAALLYRSLPVIRADRGMLLRQYAERTASVFPAEGAVLLSDSPHMQTLLQAWVRQQNNNQQLIVLNTRLLPYPSYQSAIHRQFPHLWIAPPQIDVPGARLSPIYLLYQIVDLANRTPTYYLHPSFGYYFEPLYLKPQHLAYRLFTYQSDDLHPPPLSPAIVESNDSFWASIEPDLQRIIPLVKRQLPDASIVGTWYSRALVYWGVQLQRSGKLQEAANAFQQAIDLNPANLVAQVNLEFNQSLQQGSPSRVEPGKTADAQFGSRFSTWDALLSHNGPFDEPGFCLRIGQLMTEQSLFRQAVHQFRRTIELEPDNIQARFWLSSVYLGGGLAQEALELVREIHSRKPSPDQQIELARIESMARFALDEIDAAESILRQAREQFPHADRIFEAQADIYLRSGQHIKAHRVVDEHLQINPGNVRALVNKALLCIRDQDFDGAQAALDRALKRNPDNLQALLTQSALQIQTQRYADAIETVNQVLEIDPQNQAALMNRAISLLQSGQLDAAKQDYLILHQILPQLHTVHFGLAEIARRQDDPSTAMHFYQLYLNHAPSDTEEARQVAQRLQELQP